MYTAHPILTQILNFCYDIRRSDSAVVKTFVSKSVVKASRTSDFSELFNLEATKYLLQLNYRKYDVHISNNVFVLSL